MFSSATTDNPEAGNSSPIRSMLLKPAVAATMLGPRKYKINNPNKDSFCIFTGGCADGSMQETVAKLMNEKAKLHKPAYCVFAGDNFYEDGLNSPDDIKAYLQFFSKYCDPDLKEIFELMFLQILGNHDHRISNPNYYGESSLQKTTGMMKSIPFFGERFAQLTERTVRSITPSSVGLGKEVGEERAKAEVDLTFKWLKRELFGETLDPAIHKGWVMPHFYDTFTDDSVKQLAVDSNTILEYYLLYLDDLINERPLDPNNQFVLMKEEFESATQAGQGVILFQHHPVESCGKARNEAKLYLDPCNIRKLDALLQLNKSDPHYPSYAKQILAAKTREAVAALDDLPWMPEPLSDAQNYGHLLLRTYQREGIEPDLFVVAHDHNINYYNNSDDASATYKIRQVTTGGAGEDPSHLQARRDFKNQSYMGCFLRKNGFTVLTCDKKNPKHILIDVYTTDGLHLQFDNQSHQPLYDSIIDDDDALRQDTQAQQAVTFRGMILNACDNYFRQDITKKATGGFFGTALHTLDQDDCAHFLWAYLNQPKLPSIDTICTTLQEQLKALKTVPASSMFYQFLNQEIKQQYHMDLPRLFSMPSLSELGDPEFGFKLMS